MEEDRRYSKRWGDSRCSADAHYYRMRPVNFTAFVRSRLDSRFMSCFGIASHFWPVLLHSRLRGTPIALRGWQRGRICVWSMKEDLVMRGRTLVCSLTLLAVVGFASLSHAQVSVNIGINLPAPPV